MITNNDLKRIVKEAVEVRLKESNHLAVPSKEKMGLNKICLSHTYEPKSFTGTHSAVDTLSL
jgi:hypothetical protein